MGEDVEYYSQCNQDLYQYINPQECCKTPEMINTKWNFFYLTNVLNKKITFLVYQNIFLILTFSDYFYILCILIINL